MEPLKELLAQVDTFPTLPDVVIRIEQELNKDKCDLRKVAELIALDPVLTGHLMRIANSAFFGGRARTTTTSEAIMRLGARETRSLVMTATVIRTFGSEESQVDLRAFWTLGLASAICARQIARDLRQPFADQAYLGGLVHCLGEAILAVYFPQRFAKAVEEARSGNCDLVQSVWTEFGFTHPVLACHALDRWNFPSEVIEAVEFHLDPDAAPIEQLLASVLLAADRICRELGFASFEASDDERAWLADIPGDFTRLLLDAGYADLDAYMTEQKEHLKEVGALVTSLFTPS